MVLMPCSKCCKVWRCFTDGTDYACVAPDEAPPDGWTTDGLGHATELDCIANCGVIQCYRNTAEQRQYRCFSSLELDPDQKIWQPYDTAIYGSKEDCDVQCGPLGLCCLPDGSSINTNNFDCAYKGGVFFEGYIPPNTGFPSPICGKAFCENITCKEDGQPERCVTYTLSIKATNKTPAGYDAGVLSFTKGTLANKPYPLTMGYDPVYGPKVDSIWPEYELNWESEVTLAPDEEGELVAKISISELMGLTSHFNAQNPDNPIPDTDAANPWYTGSFNCEAESVIPIKIVGCDTAGVDVIFGDSQYSLCNLPSDALSIKTNFAGGFAGYGEAGLPRQIGKSFLVNEVGDVLQDLRGFSNCVINDSGQFLTCLPCSGSYTTKLEKITYRFGPGSRPDVLAPAFLFWPASADQDRDYYYGTAYEITQEQEWEVTLTINPVDCNEQRQAKRDIEEGQFMGLRNKVVGGPGTELANLLKWFNIHAKEKGCGCKSMQKKMDRGGPQWCRDHKDEILDHLAKEAKKRGLPFVRVAAGKLVDLAIRRAEKDSA